MFQYFLISSQVHLEKNALSEAAWILSTYGEIESFKAKVLPVGGLGLLSIEQGIIIPDTIQEDINSLLKTEKIYYCFKIIPLEIFENYSEDLIYLWIEENKERILPTETWRVTVNKRHTSIKTSELITTVAKKISNPVNLKNPQKIIQIEIIGKYVGLAILEPYELIQLTNRLSQMIKEDANEEDTDIGG